MGYPRTIAILPAYNEEITLGSVISLSKQYVDEVLVVNDGSDDLTEKVATLAGATVLSLKDNTGKANAIRVGFEYAKNYDFDYVVMIDSDGQSDAEEIPSLLMPLKNDEADMVIGSRFIKRQRGIPIYRQFGQKVLNIASNLSSGTSVSDTQSGYRALNKKALNTMVLLESEGYCIESDMLSSAFDNQLRVVEVPISVEYSVPRGHKMNPVKHGVGLLSKVITAMSYRRPLFLFGMIGFLLILFGLSLITSDIANLTFIKSMVNWPYWATGTILIGIASIIAGMMLNSQLMIKTELNRIRKDLEEVLFIDRERDR